VTKPRQKKGFNQIYLTDFAPRPSLRICNKSGASMVEFLLILGAIVIYFTPLLVAAWVRHPRLAYIGGLNAALGVTVVGWAGALVWALRRRKVVALSYHGDMQVRRSFNTGLLAVSGLVVGVAMVATIGVDRFQTHKTIEASETLYATDAVAAPQWQYITFDGARMASLQSRNSVTPPAPFKGGPVTLSIAHGPDGAVVKLDTDAELTCSYVPAATSVDVSFDEGPPEPFACASAPANAPKLLFDGDHSTAYLADPVGFLARLRGVHHVTITATFSGVTEPQALEYDLPSGEPVLETASASAPAAKPAVAAAAPVIAMAAVSGAPAAADDDPAQDDSSKDGGHDRRHHHRRNARHEGETYVDGVPGPAHERHHRRHRAEA
jgi:hypothetical protein